MKTLLLQLGTLVTIIAVVFFVTGISPVYAATAGYTSIGANDTTLGTSGSVNPPGLLITIPGAGTITKITAYVGNSVNSSSQTAKIYNGSAGSLGSVIATTNTATVTTTFGWVDFTFASPVSVSATTYWIEFEPDGGNGPGGDISHIKSDTGGGANTSFLKSDIQVPTYGTDQYSMYATYSLTGGGSTPHTNMVIGNSANVVIGSQGNVTIQ